MTAAMPMPQPERQPKHTHRHAPEPEWLEWDPRPPASDTPQTGSQDMTASLPEVDFTTLIGPYARFPMLLEVWDQLSGTFLTGDVRRPVVLPVPDDPDGTPLRIAIVRHRPNNAPQVVARLQAAFREYDIAGVEVEEGYFYGPAGAQPVAVPGVEWQPQHADLLRPFRVPLTGEVYGRDWVRDWATPARVVQIDTGDATATWQRGFEEHGIFDDEAPTDNDRELHGTTVAALIRKVNPDAVLHSYRVLRHGAVYAESAVLINALNVAVCSPGLCDIVCVPMRAVIRGDAKGASQGLEHILTWYAGSGNRMPVVVCAAGNEGEKVPMAYPASAPGMVVAIGLDAAGARADYNCAPPADRTPYTVNAFGGVRRDPIGYRYEPAIRTALFGSSYAAAIVAASLAAYPRTSG